MKKFILYFLFIAVIFSSATAMEKQELPRVWKKWLEEEVAYIITSKEREIFLALKAEKEREAFKRMFWSQRDPTPGTPANEFREEHFRRLKYADEFYGRGTVKLGRETDRGRIYIILGPPVDVQRFYETSANLVPTEMWQYYGDTSLGLPPIFYVVFFQDQSIGDYKLYRPSFDGPQRLLHGGSRGPINRYEAYLELKRVSSELAEASLSLIPGSGQDPTTQSSSLSSDMLLADIQRVPQKKVESEWAVAFARHSEIVSTDYSVKYVESNSVFFVHQENGKNYLHVAIEPHRLSLTQYENKVYVPLVLNAKISGLSGKTVHQEEKSIPVEMSPEDFKNIEKRISAIGDIMPLVDGNYRIDLLIRNTNSKEFSSVEGKIASPAPDSQVLSPVLFLYDEKTISEEADNTVPFLFHGYQLYPNLQRIYTKAGDLIFYLEIYNPSPQLAGSTLSITVFNEDDKVWADWEETLEDQTYILKRFPLQDYAPGYYKLSVSLANQAGEVISKTSSEFTVSHLAFIPRPWRYNKIYPPLNHAYYALIRAFQYLSLGKSDRAIQEIEPFYHRTTPNREIARPLAMAYFSKKDYSRVIEILDPWKEIQEFEIQELIGKSHFALGQYGNAVQHFKQALMAAGEVVEIINFIGYSYLEMKESEEALEYFERSLRLNPDQSEIRQIVEKIKKNG